MVHLPSVTSLARVGTVVAGKYKLLDRLGGGGMGEVYRAEHQYAGRVVALKLLRKDFATDPDLTRRFFQEAQAVNKIRHPNIVDVLDAGLCEEGPYVVMEILEGASLSTALARAGRFDLTAALAVVLPMLSALEAAHRQGIVHRDLKPENVYLARTDAGAVVVKLVDFGIAKILEEPPKPGEIGRPMGGPTREGTVIGTPNFMAPEQLAVGGAPGPLTDLWSLGACTFAAMTGRLPFEGDVLGDIVLKVCASPIPSPSNVNPNVPPGFDAWFARACSRDPAKRFQTADELAQALAGVTGIGRIRMATLDEDQVQYVIRPTAGIRTSDLPPPNAMSPRTALLAGLVLGIAMMVGLLGFLAWRERDMPTGVRVSPTPTLAPSTAPSTAPSHSAAP
jgi:serine/threonine protein kinase